MKVVLAHLTTAGGHRLKVTLDLTGLEVLQGEFEQFKLESAKKVQELGNDARDTWVKNAESSMRSSGNYVAAVMNGVQYPFDGNEHKYVIEPSFRQIGDKDLGVLLEEGFDAFDMKPGLLKGQQSRVVKLSFDGPGRGSSVVPQDVIDDFNSGNDHTREPIKKAFSVLNPTQSKFPSHAGLSQKLKAGLGQRVKTFFTGGQPGYVKSHLEIKYQHKTRAWKGLGQSGNKFTLFRTVTTKDKNSWIHPGMPPLKILEKTVQVIEPRIVPEFRQLMDDVFGK